MSGAVARPQQLAALFLAVSFVLGGAVGWTASRVVTPATAEAAPDSAATPARPRTGEQGMLDEFARELELTRAQRAAVDSILDERRELVDSLVAPIRPQLDSARELARAQIRQRLTAEQQERFTAYLARQQAGDRRGSGKGLLR